MLLPRLALALAPLLALTLLLLAPGGSCQNVTVGLVPPYSNFMTRRYQARVSSTLQTKGSHLLKRTRYVIRQMFKTLSPTGQYLQLDGSPDRLLSLSASPSSGTIYAAPTAVWK